jgi:predicted transcriptional regulator of viral defense system
MKVDPIEIFHKHNGWLHMSEALKHGISHYTLYSLLDKGVIEQVSRGIYRLTCLPGISYPDIVTVAMRYPNAVICLISALSFHEITTQIPHRVDIAIPRNSYRPTLDWPSIAVHRFSDQAYQAGIEEHNIDGVTVKIYDMEKTLVDCFRFRNIYGGIGIVIEALEFYRDEKEVNYKKIMEYAKICRVDKSMQPYLEKIL